MKKIYNNVPVFKDKGKLLVLNSSPGKRTHGEDLIKHEKREYRVWNPYRSKAAAAIVRGIKDFPVERGTKMLYLGIAQGQTATYISDIIGEEGIIYGVEFSERAVRDLLKVTELRPNIIPILGDARKPEEYEDMVEQVDVVFSDVAQPDLTKLTLRNCDKFLKKNGFVMISVKSRSIDVTKKPKQIVENEVNLVKEFGFKVIDYKMMDPYEDDHGFILAQKV